MIKVTGTARLTVWYGVELDISEEEFDALSERKQNELLDGAIDWREVCRGAELDEIDVDDVVSLDEEELA